MVDSGSTAVTKVLVTLATKASGLSNGQSPEEDDEELQPTDDELSGPESDGQGNFTQMLFDPDYEYDEEEANFIWAYNSAYKDVRKELQS